MTVENETAQNVTHPLYVVTHKELTAGYQIAQIAHAVADFARHKSDDFTRWHSYDQRILALQTDNESSLQKLLESAVDRGLDAIPFYEPDIDDALTSIAFVPHVENKKYLSNLSLAGRKSGKINKHQKSSINGSSTVEPKSSEGAK
jgi:Mg/Co/Ni transporter MgtE